MNQYLKKDWDVLIVLDACRYDAFKLILPQTSLQGHLEEYDSQATCTFKWYLAHWSKKYEDVGLVASSPVPFSSVSQRAANNFGNSIRAWRDNKADPIYTLERFKEFDETYYYDPPYSDIKRVVLHLMPPHLPFIGPDGIALMEKLESGSSNTRRGFGVYHRVQEYGKKGGFKSGELRRLYEESLLTILNILTDHLNLFIGKKVIITSDHAELVGEAGKYDHPTSPPAVFKQLQRTVPWFEWDVEETSIIDRMRALGYV